MRLKKGDIVGRLSYNKDIIFVISDIIKVNNRTYAILKGLITRIEEKRVMELLRKFELEIDARKRKVKSSKSILLENQAMQRKYSDRYGSILHLDGDKKYSEKSQRFYRSMGLDVVVKNIPERKQPQMIYGLLSKYNPDILVITRAWWNDKKRT